MSEMRLYLIVGGVLVLGAIGYLGYHSIPTETWTYRDGRPFDVYTEEVKPGEELIWVSSICRHTDYDYTVERFIENLNTHAQVPIDVFDNQSATLKPHECGDFARSVVVPLHTSPGPSMEVSRFTTKRHGKEMVVELHTEEFTILPRD